LVRTDISLGYEKSGDFKLLFLAWYVNYAILFIVSG
jgi:hypothetical protein